MLRWPLLLLGSTAQYTACVPGRYGRECQHLCACAEYEECEDGPSGSGECSCVVGQEVRCGLPAPAEGPSSGFGLGSAKDLVFQNLTLRALPLDPDASRRSRQVFNASMSLARPQPFRGETRLVLLNHRVAKRLGLAPDPDKDLLQLLSGRQLPSTAQPFAHAYGGHQFGSWSGQLGDGRAMSLGHVLGFAPDDTNTQQARWWPWELSLKGAGKTPYSRGGDGRAALANAAREFFAPIFLESIGVPVCGTLAVVGSDSEEDRLMRDEWYSGQMSMKKPGITARVMPSFLRFGSLQLAAKRQGVKGVTQVARYTLEVLARLERQDDASVKYLQRLKQPVPTDLREDCFFVRNPGSCAAKMTPSTPGPELLRCLLQRLTERTAALVAAWMAVGFAHGVMNTDNLSLLGTTVDLNVFGFLSKYDPSWAPNHIDDTARYAFGAQPEIAKWNLQRLSDALTGSPFVADREPDSNTWSTPGDWLDASIAAKEVDRFQAHFDRCFVTRMELRLGLPATGLPCAGGVSSGCVVKDWVLWLERSGADYPRASRALADVLAGAVSAPADRLAYHAGANSTAGLDDVLQRLLQLEDTKTLVEAIRAAVPSVTLRSHVLAEAAKLVEIQRPGSKPRQFLKLLQQLLEDPFQEMEATDEVDDPKRFWQQTDLFAEKPEEQDLHRQLQERLYAMPPEPLKQLRTSCGAQ